MDNNFPDKEIKDISELLGHNELYLNVANNSSLNYLGFTEIIFKLAPESDSLRVPFLVTEEDVELPLVGNNVIEEIVKQEREKEDVSVVELLKRSIDVTKKTAEAVVNIIQSKVDRPDDESWGDVKIGGKDVVVPRGCNKKVKCVSRCGPVNEDTAALFQPNLG